MTESISVQPWPDPILDAVGHDPRSLYVETFWLPILGPTSVLLLRLLAQRFDREGDRIELPVIETSQALGIGTRAGESSPLRRTIARLARFEIACRQEGQAGPVLAVRRAVPPLDSRHLRRLPAHLQHAHDDWAHARLGEPPLLDARRNARRMAYAAMELGDDVEQAERALFGAGFHPAICRESAMWAWERRGGASTREDGKAGPVGVSPLQRPAAHLHEDRSAMPSVA